MWNYRIDQARKLVITTAWDLINAADIIDHRRQLRNDARFQRNFFQLLDFTRVTGVALDYETILELTREDIFSPESRRGFVAPNPAAFQASRTYISIRQFYDDAEQMEVFENSARALRWICKAEPERATA